MAPQKILHNLTVPMKPLNEQVIKRLQKLAGINEIKVINPSKTLKRVIEPYITYTGGLGNPSHSIIYSILTSWTETTSGDNDPMGEYKTEISLDYIRYLLGDEDEQISLPQEVIKWIDDINRLDPNQIYIFNTTDESIKFTTDPNGKLTVSIPSGISDDGESLLSRYDDKGNLVPNN